MELGTTISSVFIVINSSVFQDYLKKSIVGYVNANTDNTLQIQNSKFNLRGELVLSDILLSNNNSDTIILLETLKTKYLPLISTSSYDSSLFIEGLEVYLNQNNNGTESNYLKDDIDEILDNLFFDNLNVSNSNLFIVNDTIQHSIDINTLIINKIKRNINGINFDISMFQGGVDEYLIENFETNFELNNDFVSLENLYLSDVNQFLEGDLNFYSSALLTDSVILPIVSGS